MRVGGGTRFKALEAMACGQAIVSTALGVEGIPVQDEQEMLLADTPDAFATAVLRLIDDAARRRRPPSSAWASMLAALWRQRYGWTQIVPILDEVYERVTS